MPCSLPPNSEKRNDHIFRDFVPADLHRISTGTIYTCNQSESFSVNTSAKTWVVLVHPPREARRNELHCDGNCSRANLVSHQMQMVVARWIDEGAPGGKDARSAGRIVSVVYGNRALRDRDQAGTRVSMPPACTSRSKRISDHI
jgi:hypothetical protein